MSSTSTPKTPSPEDHALVVSVLTPPGVGAIAVIRLAGRGADQVLGQFLRRHGRPIDASRESLEADRIVHVDFCEGPEHLDDVLLAAADCADGRREIDLCAHGGVRVVERIVTALTRAGAVLHDRGSDPTLDWPAANFIEREIWTALAGARTRRAVRLLLHLRTTLPAELCRIASQAAFDRGESLTALNRLAAKARACRHLIEGATVAITGPANAGKSTLANRLLGTERTVVSPRPGTTLDWVSQETSIDGVPITLVDTPGHGRHGGELDKFAIVRAQARAAQADLELLVFDGSQSPPCDGAPCSAAVFREPTEDGSWLLVLNKNDLGAVWTPDQMASWGPAETVVISAKTGSNLDTLRAAIARRLGLDSADEGFIGLFTDRQCRIASELAAVRDGAQLKTAVRAVLLGDPMPEAV